MRKAAIYSIVMMLVCLGAGSANAEIAWESKLRDAHVKAKQEGKLMLLHFYTCLLYTSDAADDEYNV